MSSAIAPPASSPKDLVGPASTDANASSPTASLGRRLAVPFGIAALALLHHTAIAVEYALRHHVPFGDAICRWDCSHYEWIAGHGYAGERWAFLPLFPGLTHMLASMFGARPEWSGVVLSGLCLALYIVLVETVGRSTPQRALLVPETALGWFVLLYSPASYALNTNHTEALFLLLSYAAFLLAARGRPELSGLLAGACVWTRKQGVFVAIACALLVAMTADRRSERVRKFVLTGAVSLAAFAGMLLFDARVSGNPFAFLAAQDHWTHAHSVAEVFRTFWFGNPWQGHNLGTVLHHLYFFVLVALVWWVFRRSWPLGVYGLLSLLVLPLQAELINAFRYSVVLFPLLFLGGDAITRVPRWAQAAAVLGLVALNHAVTRAYVMAHWAY